MNARVRDALNTQIGLEFYSAYFYLALSAHFDTVQLPGFAGWMRTQAKEEVEHAMKFYDFLLDRGETVELQPIAAPPARVGSALEGFEHAYRNERKVTQKINELYEMAVEEHDYPVQVLLQWFITEQVEEEKITSTVVERLRMVGDDTTALLIIDSELGRRPPEGGE